MAECLWQHIGGRQIHHVYTPGSCNKSQSKFATTRLDDLDDSVIPRDMRFSHGVSNFQGLCFRASSRLGCMMWNQLKRVKRQSYHMCVWLTKA